MQHISEDPAVYERLLALNEKLKDARTPDEFIAGDVAFHRGLLESSRIEPLVAFNNVLRGLFPAIPPAEVIGVRKHSAQGIQGHGEILAALRPAPRKAQNLLCKHLVLITEATVDHDESRSVGRRSPW